MTDPETTTEEIEVLEESTEELEESTTSATLVFSSELAKRAASIKFAASTDSGRPALGEIRIRVEEHAVELLATDSYKVAWREISIGRDLRANDTVAAHLSGTWSGESRVNAKAFFDAVTAAGKLAPFVNIEISDTAVEVSAGGFSTSIPANKHEYPNGIDKIIADSAIVAEPYEGSLPAFSPAHMYALLRSTGYTAAGIKLPFRMHTTIQHGKKSAGRSDRAPELMPVRLSMGELEGWSALLMPVRVDR